MRPPWSPKISRRFIPSTATLLTFAVLIVAPASVAQAHPPPFFRMPDLAVDSRLALDTTLSTGDVNVGADTGSATVLDLDLQLKWALTSHILFHFQLPFVYADYESDFDSDEDVAGLALGNVGAAVAFVDSSRSGRRNRTRYGLGLGINAATASDSGDSGTIAGIATVFSPPDVGRFARDTTTLKIHGSGRYEADMLFVQGQAGVDHGFTDGDDNTDLRLALGLGIAFSEYWAALGELTVISDVLDDDGGDTQPTLEAGIRYHDPLFLAGLHVYWPLAESDRDRNVIGVSFDMGTRF